jgi:hypothetical protein
MLRVFVGVMLFAVVVSSDAFSQQSLRDLETATQFARAMAAVDAIKQRKKVQCVLSIANGALCQCLARALPLDTYIRSYASLIDQDVRGPEYLQLSAPEKDVVNQCVGDKR